MDLKKRTRTDSTHDWREDGEQVNRNGGIHDYQQFLLGTRIEF